MSVARKAIGTSLVVALVTSLMLVTTEAAAQSRARSMRVPSSSGSGSRAVSAIARSGRSGPSGFTGPGRSGRNLLSGSSRSGLSGLEGLGGLLEQAGRNYGHGGYGGPFRSDRPREYSYAKAYRDVGLAHAVVDLVGILVSASAYHQPYAPMAVAPVEFVPVPVEPFPVAPIGAVTVVPPPAVILQTPAYCAPPPHVYLTPPPPPMPYPRAHHPGYPSARPAPSGYSGHHRSYSGQGQRRAPVSLHDNQRRTPQRAPMRQSAPAASRTMTAPRSTSSRAVNPPMRRAPAQTSSWSYRVR